MVATYPPPHSLMSNVGPAWMSQHLNGKTCYSHGHAAQHICISLTAMDRNGPQCTVHSDLYMRKAITDSSSINAVIDEAIHQRCTQQMLATIA